MKPPARIESGCLIISQLFDGYGGYVYEAANRWYGAVYFCFAFKGDRWPNDETVLEKMLNENIFETVLNVKDGIDRLKNGGR